MSFPPHAATSPELTWFRTPGQGSKLRAAIFSPTTVYSGQINQTFTTYDGVLEIIYDGGTGTLSDVLPDMTVLFGTTPGDWDVGICRIRSIDATKVYIDQTSGVRFENNHYFTVINDFGLRAKHVLIDGTTAYMDGGIAYTDQHTNMDPVPIMGGNRELKLEGATVSTTYDWSHSYMPDGSAISSYACSAPGSSSSSGMTTSAPTITWNSVGWKLVYLTLTGANGKTFFGIRYVYIWNDANPPARAVIGENRQNVDSAGWEFSLTLYDNCNLDDIRDHALVILFAEDYYGTTKQSIGPLTGCENVILSGWIAREQINMNPEQGLVEFTAYTAQYWFEQIPTYPDGVEFVTGTPTAWTEMQNLTVDKGLWHFLHWRTTATRVMDVFLSGDTKYTKEVSSLSGNLWQQIKEMAFDQIFARAMVNRYNQLYIQVHPQLIPESDRTGILVVMAIEKQDWVNEINFDRVTIPEVSVVTGNGVAVNSSGNGTPYFSMAPGHTYPHYGQEEPIESILVSSQAQANQLFSLYREWRNNPLPDIPITFAANNRLIECCPNQYCTIDIDAADNPRGVAYSGKIIPTSVSFVFDAETGYLHTEATFEAETFEGISVNGDVPFSGDRSVPPTPGLPAFPSFPVLIPGIPTGTDDAPSRVLFLDSVAGLIYTENFDAASPTYVQVNAGLGGATGWGSFSNPIYKYIHQFFVTPNGAVYAWRFGSNSAAEWTSHNAYHFVARAPSIGATFTMLYDPVILGNPGAGREGVNILAYNPLVPETVMIIIADSTQTAGRWKAMIGGGASFAAGVQNLEGSGGGSGGNCGLAYGLGKWLYTKLGKFTRIAQDGSSAEAFTNLTGLEVSSADVNQRTCIAASTTGKTFIAGDELGTPARVLNLGIDNLLSNTWIGDTQINGVTGMACDPTGLYLMSQYQAGNKGKSSDGGNSWATLPSLPPGNWRFAYAGTAANNSPSRWVAANAVIRFTKDFGASWVEKTTASLTAINPTPDIVGVQVLG